MISSILTITYMAIACLNYLKRIVLVRKMLTHSVVDLLQAYLNKRIRVIGLCIMSNQKAKK